MKTDDRRAGEKKDGACSLRRAGSCLPALILPRPGLGERPNDVEKKGHSLQK